MIGCDHSGAIYDGPRGPERRQAGVRGAHEPGPARGPGGRRPRGRRRLPRPLDAGRGVTGGDRADGGRRDRVRDGEPDAGDRAGGPAAGEGRRRRDGSLRLPEPDQQRAGVPGRLPRRARRPREHDHRGHEGRRRARDRVGDRRRRARAGVRDPERLQPRGDAAVSRGGRRGGRAGRRRPQALTRADDAPEARLTRTAGPRAGSAWPRGGRGRSRRRCRRRSRR